MLKSLRGLRVQLLLWAIAPLIIIVVSVSVLGIVTHQSSMRELVAQRDAQLASVAADLLDERLLLHIRLLETIPAAQHPASGLPEFDHGLLYLDGRDRVIAAVPPEGIWSRISDQTAELVARVRQTNAPQISDPFSAPTMDHRMLLFAVPVLDGHVRLGLASFSHLGLPSLLDNLGTGRRGVTSLVDGHGAVLYHPDHTQEGVDISSREGIRALLRGERGAAFHLEPAGEEMVVGYSPSRVTDWGLVIYEPWADAVAPVMRASEMTPIILVLTAVAALVVIYFGMRYIIRPLQELEEDARRVAWGDFAAIEKPVGGVEEIETLRQTLHQMTTRIRGYQVALRDYLAAITHVEEEERRRVARELHDDTVQNLIALVHRVEMSEKALRDPDELARRLEQVRALATESLDSTRRLIHNLRPAYLDDLGLAASIQALAADLRSQDGSPVIQVDIIGGSRRLERDVEVAAFRTVQEALTNVIRHARAAEAQIRLEFHKTDLLITVSDDGIGFSAPQAPQDMARDGHFGLMGIHERALRFGGHLSVQSEPGRGTVLVVTLPDAGSAAD